MKIKLVDAHAVVDFLKSDEAQQMVFDAVWEVMQDHRLEARMPSGTRYAVTGDIGRQIARAALAALVAK